MKHRQPHPVSAGFMILSAAVIALATLAIKGLDYAFSSITDPLPSPSQTTYITVSPIPSPEPVVAPPEPQPVEELIASMTLHEKVCQLFVVFPEAITHVSPTLAAGEITKNALAEYPVGGFLYDRKNLQSQEQVAGMLAGVQSYAKIPLLLTCDEEGGRVNRLMDTIGTTWVGPMLDYQDQGVETAARNARTIAADLKRCGFNMDLAPVADVWSCPENTVIGDRAYSDDFQEAAQLVAAAVEGFHAGGVAAVLKHFPGHGNTSSDSHEGAAYVERTLEELQTGELLPFAAGIEAGADAVMVGHLTVPAFDSEPAPFSYPIVTGLLREEMGFEGVVITDSLQMKAITDQYSGGEAAVKAVQAGVDLLLCPPDLDAAISALVEALETGSISQARLDESVRRILTLKFNRGMLAAALA